MSTKSRSQTAERRQRLIYISDMLAELVQMAHQSEAPFLAHLIEMSYLHAREVAGAKGGAHGTQVHSGRCNLS